MSRQAAHLFEHCLHGEILNQQMMGRKAKAGIGKNEAVSGGVQAGCFP
ncbi:hypothetical protein U8P71_22750 [Rhizobium ruizarguesonis]|nr:hypothetical protein U8P71_22750 [Rhizobium ruizarguesonis]